MNTDVSSNPAAVPDEALRHAAVRRRFLTVACLGAALAALLFGVIMQSGRSGMLDHDLLGNFYDGQARALLDGHLDVDPDVPGLEGFRIGNVTHIYQGITPALARLPLLALTHRFDGRLTGVSMFLAFCVALAYVVAAAWRTRCVIRGPSAMGRLECVVTAGAVFGIGAGTLLFLGSKAWVYHEALLWGAALSLGSLTHLLYWMTRSGSSERSHPMTGLRRYGGVASLLAAVALGGLAVNTRSSIGLGPLAALGLATICLLVAAVPVRGDEHTGPIARLHNWTARVSGWSTRRSTARPLASAGVIVVGVVLAVVLYAGVNQARFGSLFGVPLDRQVLVATDQARQDALAANDNSLFGVQYVPSVLTQIVRPDGLGLSGRFPFVAFPNMRPTVIGDAVFAELDWSSSIPASEPLLFLAALVGGVVLLVPRRLLRGLPGGRAPDGNAQHGGEHDAEPPAVAAARIPVVGAALGGAAFIGFGYIAQRYLTDLYPVLVLAGLVGVHSLAGRLEVAASETADRPRRWTVALVTIFSATILVTAMWTAWANTALALQYDREIAPGLTEARRLAWLRTQQRWGAAMDVVQIPAGQPAGEPLPTPDRVGQLAVVGDCEGLYRSNGTDWYLLELGEPAGGVRLTLDRSGELTAPVVLVQSVTDDPMPPMGSARLVLEPLGGDQVRLVVELDRDGVVTRSLVGTTFDLGTGEPMMLDVAMDWRTDNVVVTERPSDEELLRVQIDLPPRGVEAVGDPTVEVSATALPTPVCDELTGRS